MHNIRPAKITSPITTLSDSYNRTMMIGLVLGAIGLGIAAAFSIFSEGGFRQFSFTYLVSFCFLLTMSIGCLFFVLMMHLTRAGWGVTVRRIAELFAMCVAPLFILALPIILPVVIGQDVLYPWVAEGYSAHTAEDQAAIQASGAIPPIESGKAGYLNPWFFTARVVIYFAIWAAMAWFFLRNSLKQDETGEKKLSLKMQGLSAPLTILFAVTIVFSSFDFEMSLAPLWFSTMFPVYFFAGSFLSATALICLTGLLLQRSGRVTDEITVDHYHDLAKLMFAFVFFWGYIGFSQFMLIWYANIPEETFWFDWRINSPYGWQKFSLLLLVGHLFIPFLGLMARTVRRNKTFLFFASIYILVMHWIDHYWVIMPQLYPEHTFTFNPLVDIPCVVGMVGLFITMFCLIAGRKSLVPLKDPRLGESLNFKNP
ncbi:MAG: quinol:cytochrome C oxidoreductase [Planctomycetota bacterium]